MWAWPLTGLLRFVCFTFLAHLAFNCALKTIVEKRSVKALNSLHVELDARRIKGLDPTCTLFRSDFKVGVVGCISWSSTPTSHSHSSLWGSFSFGHLTKIQLHISAKSEAPLSKFYIQGRTKLQKHQMTVRTGGSPKSSIGCAPLAECMFAGPLMRKDAHTCLNGYLRHQDEWIWNMFAGSQWWVVCEAWMQTACDSVVIMLGHVRKKHLHVLETICFAMKKLKLVGALYIYIYSA